MHSMDEAIRANYTFAAVRDGGAYSLLRHSADHLAEAEAEGLDVDDDEKKLITTSARPYAILVRVYKFTQYISLYTYSHMETRTNS